MRPCTDPGGTRTCNPRLVGRCLIHWATGPIECRELTATLLRYTWHHWHNSAELIWPGDHAAEAGFLHSGDGELCATMKSRGYGATAARVWLQIRRLGVRISLPSLCGRLAQATLRLDACRAQGCAIKFPGFTPRDIEPTPLRTGPLSQRLGPLGQNSWHASQASTSHTGPGKL